MDTKATGLQSDPQFYHNIKISKNFLTMQKKLLTISINAEFAVKRSVELGS